MAAGDPLAIVLASRRALALVMLNDPAVEPVFKRLDHEVERLRPSPAASLNRARELLAEGHVE